MENLPSLADIAPGETAGVEELRADASLTRRLMDLGFARGEIVRCLMRSAAGDPTAYGIRGTVVALRKLDASKILVRPKKEAGPWD